MKKRLKGLLSLWLTAALAVSTLAAPAAAWEDGHADSTDPTAHGGTELGASDTSLPTQSGGTNYYLPPPADDTSFSSSITVSSGDVNLCLNGRTFSGTITVNENASLTIDDCSDSPGSVSGATITINNDGTLTVGSDVVVSGATINAGKNATVTNNSGNNIGGITITPSGESDLPVNLSNYTNVNSFKIVFDRSTDKCGVKIAENVNDKDVSATTINNTIHTVEVIDNSAYIRNNNTTHTIQYYASTANNSSFDTDNNNNNYYKLSDSVVLKSPDDLNNITGSGTFSGWRTAGGSTLSAGTSVRVLDLFNNWGASCGGSGYVALYATWTTPSPRYTLTVVNGTGGDRYTAGTSVPIQANAPEGGQVFAGWEHTSGPGTIADPSSESTTFRMGSGAATVTAVYATPLTVISGTGSGTYAEGTVVPIAADPPAEGWVFDRWSLTSGVGTIADPTSASTTFSVGAEAATVTASYAALPSDDSSEPDDSGGDGTDTYNVIYHPGYNGPRNIFNTGHEEGDPVTVKDGSIFDPPEEGMEFLGWATEKNSDEKAYSPGDTFDMPPRTLHLYAIWSAPDTTPAPGLNRQDHYAYLFGYADGTVGPQRNLTREQTAVIFFRLLDEATRESYLTGSHTFGDVEEGRWSQTEIATLANAGIVKGRTPTWFDPEGWVTRGEFAAIAARFDSEPYTGEGDLFSDIEGHWARELINHAAQRGWVRGEADGRYRPNDPITRAEAVTLLNSVLGRRPGGVEDLLPGMITFPDNMDESADYYLDIQEAANGHFYNRNSDGTETWTALNNVRSD